MEIKLKDVYNSSLQTVKLCCPYCHSYCGFICSCVLHKIPNELENGRIIIGKCPACCNTALWLVNSKTELLLFPDVPTSAPKPNPDMPEDIKQIYLESCNVLKYSPRASAALSRLAIDKLTMSFSNKGKLNDRISDMKSKGLPSDIVKALDIVRVVGNNAVHPGEIDLTSNDKELALSLLKLLNIIVQNFITTKNEINELYDGLPTQSLKAIQKRDSKSK